MNTKKIPNRKIILTLVFVFFGMLSLVYKDPWENYYLGIALTSLFFNLKYWFKKGTSKKELVILLTVVVITFVLTTFFLFTQRYKINDKHIYSNKENNYIAVLLVYNGESPKYDISLELNNIKLREKTTEMFLSPFLLNERKNNYENIGKSQHKEKTQQIAIKLQSLLQQNNKVYIGYLYDEKYIEETLIDIVNDGHHKIIVAPIFLTEDENYSMLKKRIDKMNLFNRNIQIRYTKPLWDNETIVKSYLRKINKNINDNKILDTGIVMIGQGERGYDEGMFIASIKQNIMFQKKVKDYLVDILSFPKEKIRLGWDRYIDPAYTQEVKALLEYGVGEILCIYIDPQTTYIENNIILEKLKADIDLPEGVKIKIIDGFLDSYDFVYEIRNGIQVEMLKTWD